MNSYIKNKYQISYTYNIVSVVPKNIYISNSNISGAGMGVFTAEYIPEGTCFLVIYDQHTTQIKFNEYSVTLKGDIVNKINQNMNELEKNSMICYMFNDGAFRIGMSVYEYINEYNLSKNINTRILTNGNVSYVTAIRNIYPGEELTRLYNINHWHNYISVQSNNINMFDVPEIGNCAHSSDSSDSFYFTPYF